MIIVVYVAVSIAPGFHAQHTFPKEERERIEDLARIDAIHKKST